MRVLVMILVGLVSLVGRLRRRHAWQQEPSVAAYQRCRDALGRASASALALARRA